MRSCPCCRGIVRPSAPKHGPVPALSITASPAPPTCAWCVLVESLMGKQTTAFTTVAPARMSSSKGCWGCEKLPAIAKYHQRGPLRAISYLLLSAQSDILPEKDVCRQCQACRPCIPPLSSPVNFYVAYKTCRRSRTLTSFSAGLLVSPVGKVKRKADMAFLSSPKPVLHQASTLQHIVL